MQKISPTSKPDILSIAENMVSLRKVGKGYVGSCPIHLEKTPSFYIYPEKQYFKCYGCGEYGDVIDLVMKAQGLTFPEALERLGIEGRARKGHRSGVSRKKLLLSELRATELELLFMEVLRRHSCRASSWVRTFMRKYRFYYDDPDLMMEHLPEIFRQCVDIDEASRAMWLMEKSRRCRQDLDTIHLDGNAEEKFKLYQKITGVINNG